MYEFGTSLMVFAAIISFTYGLSELYELEQKQLEAEIKVKEKDWLKEAKTKGFKMRNGIGGVTVSIHHPSGKMFIQRDRWTFTCQTQINLENGYCPGIVAESLSLFKPKVAKDYCFLKTFTTINDTLCLSQGIVHMKEGNATIICTTINGNHTFPTYVTSTDSYLAMCKPLSENVTYIYYSNPSSRDHIEIPRDNPHIRCENFDITNNKSTKINGENTKNYTRINIGGISVDEVNKNVTLLNLAVREFKKTTTDRYEKHTIESKRLKQTDRYKFEVIWNKNDTCLWTESNKLRIYGTGTS